MFIGLLAAAGAAVIFGIAAVVQAVAARDHGLFSRLMVLVGLSYVLGWSLHLLAISRLPLYLAQVGIALSLVVTVVIAATVVREPLAARHWAAIAAMAVGLGLLVGAAGPVGHHEFDTNRTLALYVALALTLGLGLVVRRMRGKLSGVLLGALGGISYSGSPVATRSLVDPAWDLNTLAPALTVFLFGLLGFWLYSLALTRSTVAAATAPLVLLETAIPAIVGLTVFGDGVRAGWSAIALVGFVVSVAGALVLCGAESRLEDVKQPHLEPAGGSADP